MRATGSLEAFGKHDKLELFGQVRYGYFGRVRGRIEGNSDVKMRWRVQTRDCARRQLQTAHLSTGISVYGLSDTSLSTYGDQRSAFTASA